MLLFFLSCCRRVSKTVSSLRCAHQRRDTFCSAAKEVATALWRGVEGTNSVKDLWMSSKIPSRVSVSGSGRRRAVCPVESARLPSKRRASPPQRRPKRPRSNRCRKPCLSRVVARFRPHCESNSVPLVSLYKCEISRTAKSTATLRNSKSNEVYAS